MCYIMSSQPELLSNITVHSSEGSRSFYSESEYHAYQRQESVNMWNSWTTSERVRWWLSAMLWGYPRQPTYGAWYYLIGTPGWIPGTRVSFFTST